LAIRQSGVGQGPAVVVLDDLVTTGATLAAVAAVLGRAGLPVTAAAVLAATRRRLPPAASPRSEETGRPGRHVNGQGANARRTVG
jgi:orotate phosphoribosyltransferase